MKIIFLDIDGVLNSHEPLCPDVMCGRFHADKVGRLNGILRATGAKIVLSSAWRYLVHREEMNNAGLDWLLRSHGVMSGRLIGVTRPDTLVERIKKWDGRTPWIHVKERGEQIGDWLAMADYLMARPEKYVVVDDLDLGITSSCHPFVHADGSVGLTDLDAAKAVRLLNSF